MSRNISDSFDNIHRPYNETVLIFPLYEPRSAIDKITPLGNVTIQGDEANGVTFNLSIHAMMGGHVTVYWNTSDPDIKYHYH